MIKRILLAYDGSAASDQAFAFALDLARRYQAELHVLAVARPPEFADDVEAEAVIEHSRRHYDKVLGKLRPALAKETLQSQMHVVVGHPAEQIVRYAEGHGIDHIVVGHRGHSRFDRWLIGSVARQVMAYAHCGVTVVRQRH
jgi:nucleotide-binding universal stress UspA family protein